MTFDATRSVPEADRQFYAREYARPGHMKAGVEVFRAFPTDAKDFAEFAMTKLSMPQHGFDRTGPAAMGAR